MNQDNPFHHWVQLEQPRLGTRVTFATDEFFAAKERIIDPAAPVFIDDKYDDHGKWMDGWETRRRREPGHDWCLIRLGSAGIIAGVDIDTSHFTGNFAPAASIEACLSDDPPDDDADWSELVPNTTLSSSSHHFIAVGSSQPFNWLRLNIFPDGGIARLRVYGQPYCEWDRLDQTEAHELSALKNGGRVIGYNDAHYGDGWETRRRREPGHDWLVIALGHPGEIGRIEVDTAHFKGNYPDRCSLQAALIKDGDDAAILSQAETWSELMGEQKLSADNIHTFEGADIKAIGPISHVRLNIFPDGGVSRLRLFGKLSS